MEPEHLAQEIPADAGDGCQATLGALRYALVVDTNLTFRLVVRDGDGGRDEDDAPIKLLNARPTAYAGAPRSLPEGGFPWAPTEPFSVPFFAYGEDEDKDALRYCWTFDFAPELGEVCSSEPDDPAFIQPIPHIGNGIYVATLRVDDNDPSRPEPIRRVSYPSVTRVRVGPTNLWSATEDEGEVERIDPGRETIVPPGADPEEHVLAALIGTRLVHAWDSNPDPEARSNNLVSFPAAGPLTPGSPLASIGEGVIGLAADPPRNRVWIQQATVTQNSGLCTCTPVGGCSIVALLDATLLTEQACIALDDHPLFGHSLIVVDSSGAAYIPDDLGSRVTWIDPTGTTTIDDVIAGSETVLGVAARPETNEVWAVVVSVAENAAQLVVLRDGVADPDRISLGVSVAFAPGWIGRDELWLHVSESGFYRLDARELERLAGTGVPALDAAMIEINSGAYDVTDIVVDRLSGEAWASGNATGDLYRATPGGEFAVFDIAEPPADPLVADAESRLVFTTPGKLHRGSSPSEDGVITSLGLLVGGAPEPDLETGGLWTPILVPPSLALLGENGSFQRFHTTVDMTTGPGTSVELPFPLLRLLRIAPGRPLAFGVGAVLPAFSPGPIFRFDLDVDPIRATAFIGSGAAINLVANGSILEVSAPVGTEAPFAWTVVDTSGGLVPAVHRFDAQGVPFPGSFVLPLNERGLLAPPDSRILAARSLATNHLCLVTVQTIGMNDLLMIRRIAPDMTVTQLDISPDTLPAGFELVAAAATPDPDPASGQSGDVCWVAFRSVGGSTIMGFQTAGGAPARIYNGPDGLTSIAPLSMNEIWITQGTPGGVEKRLLTTSTNVLTEDMARRLTPSSPNRLLMLESRGAPFQLPGEP